MDHRASLLRRSRRLAAAVFVAGLAACGGSSSAPPPPAPTLVVDPATGTVQAGEVGLSLTATLAHASDPITWKISPPGAGTLSAAAGNTVTYTPPSVLAADQVVTVTAWAGALSSSAAIKVTPSVVVGLGASPRSALAVELSFAAAFATATSFDVYRSQAAGTLGKRYATGLPGSATGWTDAGVAPGGTYQYTVEAATAAGRTYRSAQIGVTTTAAAVFPGPPTGLLVTEVPLGGPIVGSTYTLDWDPYPGAVDYLVMSTPVAELVGDASLSRQEGIVTTPTAANLSVTAGTTLYFWVAARTGAGTSAPASVELHDNNAPGLFVPAPVLDILASAVDQETFHLYFYASPGASAHHVYIGADPGVTTPHTVPTPALDGPPQSLPLQLVKPGYLRMDVPLSVLRTLGAAMVYVAVEAVPMNSAYTSASLWIGVPVPPPPAVAPPAVPALSATRRNPHQNDLSWTPIAGTTGYTVYRLGSATEAPSGPAVIGTTSPGVTTFSDTTVAPGTVAYYRVAYTTLKGGGLASLAERVQTLFDGPPAFVPLVLVVPLTYSGAITWAGHNDGSSFHVYAWYARALFPLPLFDPKSLAFTVSPGPDGLAPWAAKVVAPLNIILTPLPLPVWGCWWVGEVYPDGTESPPSLPACTPFPSP